MTQFVSSRCKKLSAFVGMAGGLVLCTAVLGAGCISEGAYDAKVTELERLRAESRERDARYLERIGQLSAQLADLAKQSAQTEQRLGEAVRTLTQVQDTLAHVGSSPVTTRVVSQQPKPKLDLLTPVF